VSQHKYEKKKRKEKNNIAMSGIVIAGIGLFWCNWRAHYKAHFFLLLFWGHLERQNAHHQMVLNKLRSLK
jgi:hypothetical protein